MFRFQICIVFHFIYKIRKNTFINIYREVTKSNVLKTCQNHRNCFFFLHKCETITNAIVISRWKLNKAHSGNFMSATVRTHNYNLIQEDGFRSKWKCQVMIIMMLTTRFLDLYYFIWIQMKINNRTIIIIFRHIQIVCFLFLYNSWLIQQKRDKRYL